MALMREKRNETKGKAKPIVYCCIKYQFLNRILHSWKVDFVMETAIVEGQFCHNHQFGHL